LAAAHQLRDLLSSEHRVVVVERSDTFALHVSNMWLMTGERDGLDQIRRDMGNLKRPGIEWVHAEAQRLDPVRRIVDTDAGRLTGDYVVIALGAELAPESVPGFAAAAHNLYDAAGALEARAALERFDGGKIVILVASVPFRCPAAPYEAAMLVEAFLRERGIRDRTDLSLYSPEPQPMLVAGPAVGEALVGMLEERGIGYHPDHAVARIEPESRSLHFGDDTVSYDLLIGVPPHRAPSLVIDAGLVDASGYVPVHPQTLEILSDLDTLEVHFPGVFAIGDVASIRLLNAMLLPKAGVFAEVEAHVVAAAIAADIRGEPAPTRFDGNGFCYVEVGDGLAAYGSGDFFAYPAPRVRIDVPTTAARHAKEEYELVLDTWFDRDVDR
jgi:sulfide:quinone oxidoreductase